MNRYWAWWFKEIRRCDLPWKQIILEQFMVLSKHPRPFQSIVSIIYAKMKDKNILFFGGIVALLSLSYWATVFVHVVTFPRGGQGEKVVVSGCGSCSPGVRLALWGAGSTRPAAHSLHSHITWLCWRWQYGDNNYLILAIATVRGRVFSLFVCCSL